MRIIIMGTGPFAVPTAERLHADGHEIPLVVTRPLPDPPPKKLPPRPVYDWANEKQIPVFEPASINDSSAISILKEHQADLFFVCDYGQILSKECLSIPRLGGINLHGSILPRHRGAAPVQWALLRGDSEAGVTVIHMTPRLDAGPALRVASTDIEKDETALELEPRLADLGVACTVESVQMLEDWDGSTTIGEIQDKALVTKAPRFSKADGALDFRLPADYLVRLLKACQPWPGTFGELNWPTGKKIRIIFRKARSWSAEVSAMKDLSPGEAMALTAEEIGQDWSAPWKLLIAVKTTEGIFLAGRIQPAGKREMDAQEFLRGHQLEAGCHLALPDPPVERLDSK